MITDDGSKRPSSVRLANVLEVESRSSPRSNFSMWRRGAELIGEIESQR